MFWTKAVLFVSAAAALLGPACALPEAHSGSIKASSSTGEPFVAGNGTGLERNGKLFISSEGIRAAFIPFGARITNVSLRLSFASAPTSLQKQKLYVNDSSGVERDVVLGYDTVSEYISARANETFGGVQGRYSYDRGSGSLQLDDSGDFQPALMSSENATDSLPLDWSLRNWTVVAHTTTSLTFSLADVDSITKDQTVTYATYTMTPNKWSIRIVGISTTSYVPLMAFSRVFWNLDAVSDPSTSTVLNHTLQLPYSGLRVQVDNNTRVPTGALEENTLYSAYDFWHASKALGRNFTARRAAAPSCGPPAANCTGYDAAFLIDRDALQGRFDWTRDYVARVQSAWSGLRLFLFTDQAALALSTCNAFDGRVPLKAGQGSVATAGDDVAQTIQRHACLDLAPQDWAAGAAHPGWFRRLASTARQAGGPQDAPYVWQAAYSFATVKSAVTTCTGRLATVTTSVTMPAATATGDGSSQTASAGIVTVTTTATVTQTASSLFG